MKSTAGTSSTSHIQTATTCPISSARFGTQPSSRPPRQAGCVCARGNGWAVARRLLLICLLAVGSLALLGANQAAANPVFTYKAPTGVVTSGRPQLRADGVAAWAVAGPQSGCDSACDVCHAEPPLSRYSSSMRLDGAPVSAAFHYTGDCGNTGCHPLPTASLTYTPAAALTDATHTVSATFGDYGGGSTTDSWSFYVRVPPTVQVISPPTGSIVATTSPAIEVRATDNGTIAGYGVLVNGQETTASYDPGTGIIRATPVVANDTTPTVRVTAEDSIGETSAVEWQFYVQVYAEMAGDTSNCSSCHPTYPSAHLLSGLTPEGWPCTSCHWHATPDPFVGCNTSGCHYNDEHGQDTCADCHNGHPPSVPPSDYHARSDIGDCGPCHVSAVTVEHARYEGGLTCSTCHASADPTVTAAIASGTTECSACHGATSHLESHESTPTPGPWCLTCHNANLVSEHVTDEGLHCSTCHSSEDETVTSAIASGDTSCFACHDTPHRAIHDSNDESVTPKHDENLVVEHEEFMTCSGCHESTETAVQIAIQSSVTACEACHPVDSPSSGVGMDYIADSNASCLSCHTSPVYGQTVIPDGVYGVSQIDWPTSSLFDDIHWGNIWIDGTHGDLYFGWALNTCSQCHGAAGLETSKDWIGSSHCGPCHWWSPGPPLVQIDPAADGNHGNTFDYSYKDRSNAELYELNAPREAFDCTYCHQSQESAETFGVGPHDLVERHSVDLQAPGCAKCHRDILTREHSGRLDAEGGAFDCASCHESTDGTITASIKNRQAFVVRLMNPGLVSEGGYNGPCYPPEDLTWLYGRGPFVSEEASFEGKDITGVHLTTIMDDRSPQVVEASVTVEAYIDGSWQSVYSGRAASTGYQGDYPYMTQKCLDEDISFAAAEKVRVKMADDRVRTDGSHAGIDQQFEIKLDRWQVDPPDQLQCASCHEG